MNRIQDVSKIKVREDMLLCKVFEKKSKIILSDEVSKSEWDYLEVVCVGRNVDDVSVGDIVLSTDAGIQSFELKGSKYGIIRRMFCTIIVSPDNFSK